MTNLCYFRLGDEELLIEAQMESPFIDPRLWSEIRRRGMETRVLRLLADIKSPEQGSARGPDGTRASND